MRTRQLRRWCLLRLSLRRVRGLTVSVWECSPSIEAKRSWIFFQCLALSVIDGLVEVCQRRLTRACTKAPDGSVATVSVTLPCLPLPLASFGFWQESTPPSGQKLPTVITAGVGGVCGGGGW